MFSALGVSHVMRYINLRCLLTYFYFQSFWFYYTGKHTDTNHTQTLLNALLPRLSNNNNSINNNMLAGSYVTACTTVQAVTTTTSPLLLLAHLINTLTYLLTLLSGPKKFMSPACALSSDFCKIFILLQRLFIPL